MSIHTDTQDAFFAHIQNDRIAIDQLRQDLEAAAPIFEELICQDLTNPLKGNFSHSPRQEALITGFVKGATSCTFYPNDMKHLASLYFKGDEVVSAHMLEKCYAAQDGAFARAYALEYLLDELDR